MDERHWIHRTFTLAWVQKWLMSEDALNPCRTVSEWKKWNTDGRSIPGYPLREYRINVGGGRDILIHRGIRHCIIDFHSAGRKTFNILQIRFKNIVILMLLAWKFVCVFTILTSIYQRILDPLPGILTSQYANLLKTKVCCNSRVLPPNCIKNIWQID